MDAEYQKPPMTRDYADIALILKWSVIGLGTASVIGGAGYYFIHKGIKNNKKDSAYNDVVSVNKKGKNANALIGTGKTSAAYATLIHSALKATDWAGIPNTDEEKVYQYLNELRSQYEVALVSDQYEKLYSMALQKGLDDDLDSDEYDKAINIIASKRQK